MKIRTDFVTNSSSSSFIVFFDKEPVDAQWVKETLFGDSESVSIYDYMMTTEEISQRVVSDYKVMDELLEDYNGNKVSIRDKLIEEISGDIHWMSYEKERNSSYSLTSGDYNVYEWISEDEIPFGDEYIFKQETGKDYYRNVFHDSSLDQETKEKYRDMMNDINNKNDKIINKLAERIADGLLEKYKDKFILYTSYDDGGEALLEHGEIFGKIPHIRFSHH